jgi:hypothetical protein
LRNIGFEQGEAHIFQSAVDIRQLEHLVTIVQ